MRCSEFAHSNRPVTSWSGTIHILWVHDLLLLLLLLLLQPRLW
jgi:hypothetical protein